MSIIKKIINNKIIINMLFVIYIIVLFRLTVFRGTITLLTNGKLNLILFNDLLAILHRGYVGRFIYLGLGNIVWFVPFGLYIKWKNPKDSIFKVILRGLLLSLSIEILQFILGTGITELDDLILNTFGTFLGGLTGILLNKYIR